MKIILFADNEVGLKILEFLMKNFESDLQHVVTAKKNSIYRFAKKNKLKVSIYNDFIKLSNNLNFDYGILAWWPNIIPEALISKANKGFINTHPSLLPFNRGKHYNFWAIVEESPFGVSIHMVEKGIDTGPVIAQKEIKYSWIDNGESLYFKAQIEMIKLFKKMYPDFRKNIFNKTIQDLSKGSYHNSYELEIATKIDLNKKYLGKYLINLLRAKTFKGYQGCWFEENDEKYEITVNINKIKNE